ncbi:hypothetical protein NECAME_08268, partial [Necator americanus]
SDRFFLNPWCVALRTLSTHTWISRTHSRRLSFEKMVPGRRLLTVVTYYSHILSVPLPAFAKYNANYSIEILNQHCSSCVKFERYLVTSEAGVYPQFSTFLGAVDTVYNISFLKGQIKERNVGTERQLTRV